MTRRLVAASLAFALVLFTFAYDSAAAPTATEIYAAAQAVNPGEDQQSQLTLLIADADGNTRKVIIKRFWKQYHGKDNLDSKVLLFHEYPPESRGTAFMTWTYTTKSGIPADRWIYIPILRKVNKLPGEVDENIHGSDLRASDMDSRPSDLDDHDLLREESIGSKTYYVVESVPKTDDPSYPYSRVIRWIAADNFLIDKVDYYDREDRLLKKQTIAWKQVKNAWVWKKVVIANAQTGSQTTLNLTNIQVGKGLKDSLFTERMMRQGASALQ
ncbi:MAG: outer membrane lipoprotein-sorting protein [Leptospirillia bacterium]